MNEKKCELGYNIIIVLGIHSGISFFLWALLVYLPEEPGNKL